MFLPAASYASPTGDPDPELRVLLEKAIANADSFEDKYDAEVWLSDMSVRLQRHVPKALPDADARLQFLRLLHSEAQRARVQPELALAVIDVESRFNRHAISSAGAQGYMQIMPFWLKELKRSDASLFDARTNLRMGCTILRYYYDLERGDLVKALARYNGSYGRREYPDQVIRALNKRWYRS
ncbi:MAG: lytic transglycosylase domain-containing protein [Pseudomonadota bacterium]